MLFFREKSSPTTKNSKRFLGENPDIASEIENQLRKKLGLFREETIQPNDQNQLAEEVSVAKGKKARKSS